MGSGTNRRDCMQIMGYISAVMGGFQWADTRIFAQDWAEIEAPYIEYLTTNPKLDELLSALHVSENPNRPVWSTRAMSVVEGYDTDYLVDYSAVYNYLIDRGHPLIIMSGIFDAHDGALSTYAWMKDELELEVDFWREARRIYYVEVEGKMTVGGYWHDNISSGGAFTVIALPKSGHYAPADNYDASFSILKDAVEHGSLICRKDDCKVVDEMCKFMEAG